MELKERSGVKTHPPLSAPTGLRAGRGATTESSLAGEVVKARTGVVRVRARAPWVRILEAMF